MRNGILICMLLLLIACQQPTIYVYTHSTPLVATPFGDKPSDTYRYTAQVERPQWLNCSLQVVYMD